MVPRGLLADYLIHGGRLLPERDTVAFSTLPNETRGDAQAVVGKYGVAGDLLLERDFDGAMAMAGRREMVEVTPKR